MKTTYLLCAAAASFVFPDCAASAMELLAPGCIRPQGWLLRRLELQRDGLTGHAEELYDDIGKSDWLTGERRGGEFSWERGPYYAKGLVSLAFALDDAALKDRSAKWIDAFLRSQREDGDFGPKRRNWWANMIALWTLRDWCDATGDERVVQFMERYFAFQREAFASGDSLAKDSPWAVARAGDELDVILWLHRKTGKAEWLDFAKVVAAQSADWTSYYRRGGFGGYGPQGYRAHIVNFMQGLKFPALKWLLYADDADRGAYAAAFAPDGWAMRQCGRPDMMLNGSEPLSDASAAGGTELCAIAERIVSCGLVLAATGDAAVADDLEDAAYNALQATVLPDGRGIRYYCLLNQPVCIDKGLMFANNGMKGEITGANCPGPHSGFGCCRSNWHVAWPKFVQSMWMTKEGGIAAVAHGPSRVTATLPCGRMTLCEETDYPYSGKVRIRIEDGNGRFPLFVRVPRWAKVQDAGSFRMFERDWRKGDVVDVEFPMETGLSFWGNDAVAVRRGPLVYALKMESKWTRPKKYTVPYEKREVDNGAEGFSRWEVRPKGAWNYALELSGKRTLAGAEVRGSGRAAEILVRARRTGYAGWGTLRADAPGRAVDPPCSPMSEADCAEAEVISLVPLSETQIRITLFPWLWADD